MLVEECRSEVESSYRMGPRTLPWGTPKWISEGMWSRWSRIAISLKVCGLFIKTATKYCCRFIKKRYERSDIYITSIYVNKIVAERTDPNSGRRPSYAEHSFHAIDCSNRSQVINAPCTTKFAFAIDCMYNFSNRTYSNFCAICSCGLVVFMGTELYLPTLKI